MARTSYSYEKFQREKKKAEKKRQREEEKRARQAAKKAGVPYEGGAPVVDAEGSEVRPDAEGTDASAPADAEPKADDPKPTDGGAA